MYRPETRRRKFIKIVLIVIVLAGLIIGGAVYASRRYYYDNLKPVSSNQTTITITIEKGSSVAEIATLLKQKQLIKNEWAFKQFVRNNGLQDQILAGTYALKPSQSVAEIVTILTEGKITSKLVTIKPGQRLDQVKQTFINSGFDTKDVEAAFEPTQYEKHPALVDKPIGASLEGYLYPESFQKTEETTPKQIITLSLDEMQVRLTPDLREAFSKQSLSVHRAIILASIIEREVSVLSDKPIVAQVFLKRLNNNIKLESDATASYGAILANKEPTLKFESLYNTYLHEGLPPGPISNASESSLQAVANPAASDWLYFVSGDDGKTYFSKTLEEHESLTAQHCKKLCQ